MPPTATAGNPRSSSNHGCKKVPPRTNDDVAGKRLAPALGSGRIKSLTQRAVLRLRDPSIAAAGVLRADKILDAVRDSAAEEIGDRGGHPPALLATGQRGRRPARRIAWVAGERGERRAGRGHTERPLA